MGSDTGKLCSESTSVCNIAIILSVEAVQCLIWRKVRVNIGFYHEQRKLGSISEIY